MEKETILSCKEKLLGFAPDIANYNTVFKALNRRWNSAITAGLIEAGRMEQDAARLFGPLIEDMRHTKEQYGATQKQLVDAILMEMSRKVVSQIIDAAKFTINILKRNLFERTADVGYLATDSEIVNFLKQSAKTEDESVLAAGRAEIRERLAEYQYEYTVYKDILILDTGGRVLAALDEANSITRSGAQLIRQTLDIDPRQEDQYLETYAETDLFPGQGKNLIYSQKIMDPDTEKAIGVLCLGFNLADEAHRIFTDLSRGNSSIVSAVLDGNGQVMFSSRNGDLPEGTRIPVDIQADFRLMDLNGKTCFVTTVPTDGYQGFYGLTWYGMAMIPTRIAFKANEEGSGEQKQDMLQDLNNFSGDLSSLRKQSEDLLGAMKIDSINGEVQAAKFRAFQGNNIADRNLYERANDVCWWALTPLFRTLLTKHEKEGLAPGESHALKTSLQYINDLYTPYLRLVLADTGGTVLAVSDPPDELEEKRIHDTLPKGQDFIGTQVDGDLVRKAMALPSSKDYAVSGFMPSPLYGGRHTYIYTTAVRDPENIDRPAGVIQIVFDSEPQFEAMLTDVLPRDETNAVVSGCLPIKKGERDSTLIRLEEKSFALGLQVSDGYREYKVGDGYSNDVICMVFVPA